MTAARSMLGQPDGQGFGASFRAQLDELFAWRRDERHFLPTPVPPALLDALLESACLAPSVGLSQPWRFVTVDQPARRSAVRDSFLACNAAALEDLHHASDYARLKLAGLDQAPCHLAVFSDPDPQQGSGLGRRTMPETAAYSTVLAIHTLWLAAAAQGLGLGWVSILDPAAVTLALDVPAAWQLVAYLCLGTPAEPHQTPELEREGWEWRRMQPVVLAR